MMQVSFTICAEEGETSSQEIPTETETKQDEPNVSQEDESQNEEEVSDDELDNIEETTEIENDVIVEENVEESKEVEIDPSKELNDLNQENFIEEINLLSAPLLGSSNGMLYVSKDGDDETGDGSEINPYASIQKAHEEANDGDSIILLSDLDAISGVNINKSITIKSKDGEGPYIIKRFTNFNSPMITISPNGKEIEFMVENTTLDDDFINGGGNQQGIISVRSSGVTTKAIIGGGTTIKNYGGSSGIHLIGNSSEVTMKAGSLITTGGNKNVRGYSAVWNQEANFIMEKDSAINEATGVGITGAAIFSRYGNNSIDGIVSNCSSSSNDYAIINFAGGINEIGTNAKIFGNTTKHGTIYAVAGCKLTVRGEIYNNTTDATNTWTSGIYVVDNGPPSTVYIEEGAYIHDNTAYLGPFNPYSTAVYANVNSKVIMNGGRIVNNITRSGVSVNNNGQFIMNGGEISGNDTGIKVESRGAGNNNTRRVILNGGTLSNISSDISIMSSNAGFLNGSFAYLSNEVLSKSPKINYERVDMIWDVLPSVTVLKSIIANKSLNELYLGTATTSGENKLKSIEEVAAGKLLTTWFASSEDDHFTLDVSGLSKENGDVYVTMVPVNDNGTAFGEHKTYLCDKTISGSRMTVHVDAVGSNNSTGYAFALFANPEIIEETYVLHYETDGGTEYEDKVDIKFTDNQLAPEINPTKTRYYFVGWYMDEGLTREYSNHHTYADIVQNETTAKEATLYAKWETHKPVIVDPPIRKIIDGNDDKDTFVFTMKAISNTVGLEVIDMPMPEGSVNGVKKLTQKGGGEYEFGEFELKMAGTYVYQMKEEKGNLEYEYDGSTYIVTYIVVEEGDHLVAERTIQKDGKEVDNIIFTNKNIKSKKVVQKTNNVRFSPPNTGDFIDMYLYGWMFGISSLLITLLLCFMKRVKRV